MHLYFNNFIFFNGILIYHLKLTFRFNIQGFPNVLILAVSVAFILGVRYRNLNLMLKIFFHNIFTC